MKTFFLILSLLIPTWVFSAEADSLDRSTPQSTVNCVLQLISGPKGEQRDWVKFRSLFTEGAQLSALNYDSSGKAHYRHFSVDQFIRQSERFYVSYGFLEKEIQQQSNTFNGIAQVFQTYYARAGEQEERGVNTYQLVKLDNKWYISSILWVSDRNGTTIPNLE